MNHKFTTNGLAIVLLYVTLILAGFYSALTATDGLPLWIDLSLVFFLSLALIIILRRLIGSGRDVGSKK